MKKIVQISAIDGTMSILLKHLNDKIIENNYELHCVCTPGTRIKEITKNGAIYHPIKIDRSIKPISNFLSILKMVKLFRRIKPDIVHVHTPIASVLGRIAAKIANVPCVIYTAHGFYFHEGMSDKEYKFYFNIEKYIGRYFTDFIFTQSYEDYEVAKKNKFLSRKNSNNYLHIGNGIDLNEKFNFNKIASSVKDELRKKHNINKDDIVVTFIGRLVKEKGIFDFLESYNLLNTKNVKFIVVGGFIKSERDQETYKTLESFKKNENIIFTGHVDNINEYLYLSDIFCLPSYREGMPRSIIEAMSMKNAVIATNIRGSREEVVNGETGYLVDLKSSEQIAEKIDYLIDNEDLLNEFKENGYSRAKELFDEDKVVEKQLKIFKKVTEGEINA